MAVAQEHGHDGFNVNWLTERGNRLGSNGADHSSRISHSSRTTLAISEGSMRKEPLHAGLMIIVPQVVPALQRELFALVLQELTDGQDLVNELIPRRSYFSRATFCQKFEKTSPGAGSS